MARGPIEKYFEVLPRLTLATVITSTAPLLTLSGLLLLANGYRAAGLTLYAFTVLCDKLDGLVARRMGTVSAFGKALDNVSDAVNFCLAPPLILALLSQGAYWVLVPGGIYLTAGLWRLAHYDLNELEEQQGEELFVGIPTTVAASWFFIALAGARWVSGSAELWVMAGVMVVLGLLMVSSLRYAKRGMATSSLYVLMPAAILSLHVF